jgi:type II secretory pathway pseudopilin PulG
VRHTRPFLRRRSGRCAPEDRGAALFLAIGFVFMIGAIAAGLASVMVSSLNGRATLTVVRNRQYAADGAIERAITQVRNQGGGALSSCSAAGANIVTSLNGATIRVDWTNACTTVRGSDGTPVAQHDVVFSACVDTGVPCAGSAVIINALVNFEQGSTGAVTKTYVQSWSVNA